MPPPSFDCVCIFNSAFERNIPHLRRLYGEDFASVSFLSPFYRGDDPDVKGVYRGSFHFQGYVSDSLDWLMPRLNSDFVIFTGDDCVLNRRFFSAPDALDRLNLTEADVFLCQPASLYPRLRWFHAAGVLARFYGDSVVSTGTSNALADLPPHDVIRERMTRVGVDARGAPENPFAEIWAGPISEMVLRQFGPELLEGTGGMPLMSGISDFFIVRRSVLPQVAHLMGCLAAFGMFVEAAAPLALISATDRIATTATTGLKFEWTPGLGPGATNATPTSFDELETLMDAFPDDVLFRHPVKLSGLPAL